MQTNAIVLTEPKSIAARELGLVDVGPGDVQVAIDWSAISSGTERLLYTGRMPAFPGMGYPLVPGYEAVGRVTIADEAGTLRVGDTVFVPGSTGFKGRARPVRGVGLASRRGCCPRRSDRALARRKRRAARARRHRLPTRWAARCRSFPSSSSATARSAGCSRASSSRWAATPPKVWETNAARRDGAEDYEVVDPRRRSAP